MATVNKHILLALILILTFGPQAKVMPSPLIVQPGSLAASDSVLLPFTEGWDQGTFAYQSWVHSGNWSISIPTGNPFPSATFTGLPAKVNYNDTLQSILLSASEYTCATIYLDFDFMLVDQNHTGAEFLTVEVQTDSVWKKLAEHSNSGSIGWSHRHIEIAHAKGRSFTVRFRAHGANSADILHWYVDNIHAYAICRPPLNLSVNQSQYHVTLTWTPPDCSYDGPIPQWIHWDDGTNFNAISAGIQFDAAIHFLPEQIANLSGGSITKISFFPCSSGNASFRARIWQGAAGDNMIIDQGIPAVTWDQWNIVDLNTPVLIDISKDLWVGVEVTVLGGYIVGCDDGPAIDGFGNMLNYQGSWYTLIYLNPSLDYNWNIQACVETLKSATIPVILPHPPIPGQTGPVSVNVNTTGSGKRFIHAGSPDKAANNSILMGYNVWRTDSTGDTSTFHKLNTSEITDTTYTDIFPDGSQGVYNYYVTAVMHDSATLAVICESPGTNRLAVSVPAVGIGSKQPGRLIIFPNPSADIINVSSDQTISSVAILNYTGREIYTGNNVNSKSTRLDVSALPPGIYFVKVTREKGTGISKITVVH